MKMLRPPRKLFVGSVALGAFLLAGVTLGPGLSLRGPSTQVLGEQLTGTGASPAVLGPCTQPGFCITGDIADLYPGVANDGLVLTVTNPNPVDINVATLTVTVESVSGTHPGGTCATTDLSVTNYSGPTFNVPANDGTNDGIGTASLPITLDASAPDNCQGADWILSYKGTAYSNTTIATTTVLGSSNNPSTPGAPVTFTATVSAPSGDPTPTGTVAFKDNGTTLMSVALNGGQAQYTTSSLSAGSHPMIAVYTSDTYYASSTGALTQQVGTACSRTISTTTPGNLTVASPQVVCITGGGSVTGNVTVNSGGTLDLSGGKVGGNLQSSGTVSVTSGSSVGGNLQTTGGGPVNVAGASVGGNLQLQSETVGPDSVCGTTVKGNLQVQSNAVQVTIGGTGCAGNNVGGNIQVQNNTGGGSLTNNAAGNNCQLQGDKPPIGGSGNTAKGTPQSPSAPNSCNKVGGA